MCFKSYIAIQFVCIAKATLKQQFFDVNTICRPVHCSRTWEINIFRGSSA